MKIKIYGAEGCTTCSKLKKNIENVVADRDKDIEVVKVSDMETMASKGIMSTPAVAVDGEVKTTGRMLNEEEIRELID